MRRLGLSSSSLLIFVVAVVVPRSPFVWGFHPEHVDDMQCVPCNSTTYCTGGQAYACPDNSLSDFHADSSTVDDCTCVDGFNRTGDVCYVGLPPYYWKAGIRQLCPANMKTTSPQADSQLSCVCDPGYQPNPSGEGCLPCGVGSAKAEQSNATCILCDEDTFADTTGLLNCKPCTENASSAAGASACLCDAGYVSSVASNAPADGSACVACPANSYREQEHSACQTCGGNMLSPHASDSRFDCLCDAGYYFEGFYGHSDSCLACPVNTFKDISTTADNIEACNACPANTSSPQASAEITDCECLAGYEATENGLVCAPCSPGSNKSTTGVGTCAPCPPNTFAASLAALECVACMEGSTAVVGSDSIDDCVCDEGNARIQTEDGPECSGCFPGTYAGLDACLNCTNGTFSNDYGLTECATCPANASSVESPHVECQCKKGYKCPGPPVCTEPVSFPIYGEHFAQNGQNSDEVELYGALWSTRAGTHSKEFIDFRDKDGWAWKGWKIPMGDTDGTTQLDDWVLAAYGGYPTAICNNPMDNLPCYITADVSASNEWECHRGGFPINQAVDSCPYESEGDMHANICPYAENYLSGCHSGSGELATDPITGAGPRDYFFDVHIYTSVDPYNQELNCKTTNAVLRIFGRNYYPYGVLVSKDDIWSFLDPATNPYIDAFYEYSNGGDGDCVRMDFGSRINNMASWASTAIHLYSGPICSSISAEPCPDGNCEACPANTYSNLATSTLLECFACQPNSTSVEASESQDNCLCVPGFYEKTNHECEACAAGFFSDQLNVNACPECTGGQFSTEQATVCSTCPTNSLSHDEPHTSCQCDAGYHCNGDSPCPNGDCVACPNATFSDIHGDNVTCQACQDGATSLQASTTQDDCQCMAGYFTSGPFECQACAGGEYSDALDSTTCQTCDGEYVYTPIDNFPYDSSTDCENCELCAPDYYDFEYVCSDWGDINDPTQPWEGDEYDPFNPGVRATCETFATGGDFGRVYHAEPICANGEIIVNAIDYDWQGYWWVFQYGKTITPENEANTYGISYPKTWTTYRSGGGAYACCVCGGGVQTPKPNASGCTGSTPTHCNSCPDNSGTIQDASPSNPNIGLESCSCNENFYGPLGGPCVSCHVSQVRPAGRINDATAITDCECLPGYQPVNVSQCSTCLVGYFKEGIGNDICRQCPATFTTELTQSSNASDCVCQPGHKYVVGATESEAICQICPQNTYKVGFNNDTQCLTCDPNKISPQGSTSVDACVCQARYFDAVNGYALQRRNEDSDDVNGGDGVIWPLLRSTFPNPSLPHIEDDKKPFVQIGVVSQAFVSWIPWLRLPLIRSSKYDEWPVTYNDALPGARSDFYSTRYGYWSQKYTTRPVYSSNLANCDVHLSLWGQMPCNVSKFTHTFSTESVHEPPFCGFSLSQNGQTFTEPETGPNCDDNFVNPYIAQQYSTTAQYVAFEGYVKIQTYDESSQSYVGLEYQKRIIIGTHIENAPGTLFSYYFIAYDDNLTSYNTAAELALATPVSSSTISLTSSATHIVNVNQENWVADILYQTDPTEGCALCPKGYFKNESGNGFCTPCPPDTFSDEYGSLQCQVCPLGTSTGGANGRSYCYCDIGTVPSNTTSAETLHDCIDCATGKFKNVLWNSVCTECSTCPDQNQRISEICTTTSDAVCGACQANSNLPAGEDMRTFCNCNAGYEANETNDQCVACAVGEYRNTNANNSIVCETCEEGKFTTQTATAVCSTCSSICATGFYVSAECVPTSDIQCSACTVCDPGYYSQSNDSSTTDTTCGPTNNNNRNDTTCALCEASHYCENGVMYSCGVDSISNPGSSSSEQCRCSPGFYYDGSGCVPCERDAYCPDGTLIPCPEHSFNNLLGSDHLLACNCHRKYHRIITARQSNLATNFTCHLCEIGDFCFNNTAFNCSDDRMVSDPGSDLLTNCTCVDGFYNNDDNSACIPCPYDTYCMHGVYFNCSTDRHHPDMQGTSPDDCFCRPGSVEGTMFVPTIIYTFVPNLEDCGGTPGNGNCITAQSSIISPTRPPAEKIDNDYTTTSPTQDTDVRWWRIDFGSVNQMVNEVKITSRNIAPHYEWDSESKVYIGNDVDSITNNFYCGSIGTFQFPSNALTLTCHNSYNSPDALGVQYLWVYNDIGVNFMNWAEIEISGWTFEEVQVEMPNGLCEICESNTFCEGDDIQHACPTNAESPAGSDELMDCKCSKGFGATYNASSLTCTPCAEGTFKHVVDNTACQACTVCSVATHSVYEYEACRATANAVCSPCTTCTDGFQYILEACQDKVQAVCANCTVCDYPTFYTKTPCRLPSPQFNTECEAINYDVTTCAVGSYRGQHTTEGNSFCASCLYRDTPYLGYTLHEPTTHGQIYNDAYSCSIRCLGHSKMRNSSNQWLGCVSCETGNVLLKEFQDDVDDLVCSFTCKQGYERVVLEDGSEDCFLSALPDTTSNTFTHTVKVTNIERDQTGFTINVLHSNHSRFLVVVGPTTPSDCRRIRGCCYDGQWRVSTMSQAGFPSSVTDDGCSKSPLLNASLLTANTLQFSVPDSLLSSVGNCSSSPSATICDMTVSIIDTLLWGVASERISIRTERAVHYAVVGEQEYIPLDLFHVNVFLGYVLPSGESVYIIQTRVETQLNKLGVKLRVLGMNQLSESEVNTDALTTCIRSQFQSGVVVNENSAFNVSAGSEFTSISFWRGSSSLVQAYYTLNMDIEGIGGQVNDMDVVAMREMTGFLPLCTYPEVHSNFDLVRVNAFSGLGAASVYAMNWVSNPTQSVHGELGTLSTFVVQSLNDMPVSISVKNALAVYIRTNEAHQTLQAHIHNATSLQFGNLDFTYDFRRLCRAQGIDCAYEYLRPPPYSHATIHALHNCSQGQRQASDAWLKTYFGVPHDDGHIEAICSRMLEHPEREFTAFLINTMSHVNRNVWGIWQDTSVGDITSYIWVNFQVVT